MSSDLFRKLEIVILNPIDLSLREVKRRGNPGITTSLRSSIRPEIMVYYNTALNKKQYGIESNGELSKSKVPHRLKVYITKKTQLTLMEKLNSIIVPLWRLLMEKAQAIFCSVTMA
jgi:hypothetical protein